MYSPTPGCVVLSRPSAENRPASASGGPGVRADSLGASAEDASVPRDAIIAVIPEVKPLLPRDLAEFDTADQYLIAKLLQETFEYVDHPAFHEPRAEQVLFGQFSRRAPGTSFFPEPHTGAAGEHAGGAALDVDTERLLFKRLNYSRMRVAELIAAHAGRRMSRSATREMLAWMHRALILRGRLAQANIPLVMAMAKRNRFSGLDHNEVISAGNYALLRSIDRFDCSRGFKFSTYACQGILQRILHVVESTRRYRSHFVSDFGEAPEKDDSAARRHQDQVETSVDDLRQVLRANQAGLTPLELAVIGRRFGLPGNPADGKPMTLQEIGGLMGVTKERVRQIQKRALIKLRMAMEQLQSVA
jgi:RNA polymerase primary sigma factor